jgi:hypothetical protein
MYAWYRQDIINSLKALFALYLQEQQKAAKQHKSAEMGTVIE